MMFLSPSLGNTSLLEAFRGVGLMDHFDLAAVTKAASTGTSLFEVSAPADGWVVDVFDAGAETLEDAVADTENIVKAAFLQPSIPVPNFFRLSVTLGFWAILSNHLFKAVSGENSFLTLLSVSIG